MAELFSFPTESVRSQIEIERLFRKLMHEARASQQAADTIFKNIEEFLKILSTNIVISVPVAVVPLIESQIANHVKEIQQVWNRLMFERIMAEAQHCRELGIF